MYQKSKGKPYDTDGNPISIELEADDSANSVHAIYVSAREMGVLPCEVFAYVAYHKDSILKC